MSRLSTSVAIPGEPVVVFEPEGVMDTLQGLHIYVLDVFPSSREGMELLLETWGCQPHMCASVNELSGRLEGGEPLPDALITDYSLPGQETGIDIINQIHSQYSVKIPALLITGDYDFGGEQEEQAGEYLEMFKPVKPGRLRTWLRTVTRRSGD